MRVVKGYTREHYERQHLFRIDRRLLKQQLKMGFVEALTSPVIETLSFVAAAAAILYFATDIVHRPDQTPEFMTLLICLGAIFDPVRKLSTIYPKLQRANAASQRIFELVDSPSEYDQDAGKPRLTPLRHTIEFDNVTFTYPKASRPAVRGVSLTVRRGETIALVGPNGSGKTTLVSLLPRFFPLDSGRILIDGQDTAEVNLSSLRKQFSLITQESVIFADTVKENIAYGRPEASFEEIVEAARKAFADEFIQQMPDGYDSVVGEHGATLSGGQRQRLAIARAILRNAPILIFDEATSQVDPESELKIHQAIDAFLRDRTAFVIAHRYSTISDADRILVMDDGEMVAVGTHDQLFKSCPLYRRLYETQFRHAG
jgi:ABC-type multidrug transport system fused ATPase/permease subunit